MRMNKKYRVWLSEAEKAEVENVLNGAKTAGRYRKRASILMLADENAGKPMKHEEIAARCGVSNVTVYHTLRDYCEHGIGKTLYFQKQETLPRPALVTGEKEARIIALACGEPPEGFSRWTVRLLTEKVVELSILPEASRETIRRTLKKRNLSLT
jgi:transposase